MVKSEIKTYEQAVEYLYQVPRFTTKSSMEDTKAFLKRMGSPERNMKIIHVAGTNGKGSVCAYLRSILMEMGYKVGTFTSPHLVEMNERVQINANNVSKEKMYQAFSKIYDMLDFKELELGKGYHPTFFEFLFFMCMEIFAWEKPDYVILETGLGGRLDATNSVENPCLSIITKIGMDHMEYLGDTLEAIAGEKAGIIKKNVPVIYDANVAEAASVIEKKAKECESPLYKVSKSDYRLLNFKNKIIDFSYHSRYYDYIRLSLETTAFYQMENASLAMRAAEVLFTNAQISKEVMIAGALHTHWAGRMEEVLPEVYVDGAHNEDGIGAFIESVRRDECRGTRYLIFSVVRDKYYEQMIRMLIQSGLFAEMAAVTMHNGRTLAMSELQEIFHQYRMQNTCFYDSVADAYKKLANKKQKDDKIYVAGSLYLVGEFKEMLRSGQDD